MPDTKIHIVHIIPTLSFGGAERFVVNLINASDPAKFRYTIITFFDTNPLSKEIQFSDCQVEVVKKMGKISLKLFSQIKKRLQELRPDVVHTHLFGGDVWGRMAAHAEKIPVVTTEHSFNLRESVVKQWIRKWLKNYSDYYTVPSVGLRDFLQKEYRVTRPVVLIRHGIAMERFNFSSATINNSLIRFSIIGRLVKEKGHEYVLRALSELSSLSWSLEIIGEGVEEESLKQLARELKIADRVVFSGSHFDIPQKLQHSEVVLVPSIEGEGLGIVVMEAMAAGRLVLGSRVAGISELIKDKENGLLVEPGNVGAWKETLEWCFKHNEEIQKMAKMAQQYAKEYFSSVQMAQNYEEIYLTLAKKK